MFLTYLYFYLLFLLFFTHLYSVCMYVFLPEIKGFALVIFHKQSLTLFFTAVGFGDKLP